MKYNSKHRHALHVMLYVCTLLLHISLTGCDRSPATPTTMVNDFGTYSFPDNSQLELYKKPQSSIVLCKLTSASGDLLFEDDLGGNFSRWYIVRGNDNSFWVYSGDIGLWVWKNAENGYSKTMIETLKDPLVFDMPYEYIYHLPSRNQDEIDEFRKAYQNSLDKQ